MFLTPPKLLRQMLRAFGVKPLDFGREWHSLNATADKLLPHRLWFAAKMDCRDPDCCESRALEDSESGVWMVVVSPRPHPCACRRLLEIAPAAGRISLAFGGAAAAHLLRRHRRAGGVALARDDPR